ncbi:MULTISPECIES: hydantoinase B/oxoprolinase family protein [Paracoccus]|uniref:hydantoinase B/oxoprolinase family protein n=1 Tax=Paracoccus TaxID=265 RepID=UPI001FB5C703|nr:MULTISPECIES: hydantoinase B/oxoprolinase family protein [Paracoccus]MCJ1899506.1 hydantoinase B/oxoprolinase family protein [Paracoccus versutus]MDF3904767.1 hydantoinase B/oxoprolinase family protein [Paracoccus sp. AS002]
MKAEIIRRFGLKTFLDGAGLILDHAEAQVRRILATIPDGDYFFTDCADEDAPEGLPIRIALTPRIRGGRASWTIPARTRIWARR